MNVPARLRQNGYVVLQVSDDVCARLRAPMQHLAEIFDSMEIDDEYEARRHVLDDGRVEIDVGVDAHRAQLQLRRRRSQRRPRPATLEDTAVPETAALFLETLELATDELMNLCGTHLQACCGDCMALWDVSSVCLDVFHYPAAAAVGSSPCPAHKDVGLVSERRDKRATAE